jgi:hypothetical protein
VAQSSWSSSSSSMAGKDEEDAILYAHTTAPGAADKSRVPSQAEMV